MSGVGLCRRNKEPDSLQNTLPTVEALEAELADLPAPENEDGPDESSES